MKNLTKLADADLAAVAGAKKGKGGLLGGLFDGPVAVVQTNVGAPIIQLAVLNGGGVSQAAGMDLGNLLGGL